MEALWKALAQFYLVWFVAGSGLIVAFLVYVKERSLGVAIVIMLGTAIFCAVLIDPMFYFGKIGEILRALFSFLKSISN